VGVASVFAGVVTSVPLVGGAVFADFDDKGFVEIEVAGGAWHFRNHFVTVLIGL